MINKGSGADHRRTMTPEFWGAITELFGQAMDLPADQRSAFLSRLGAENPEMAGEVGHLLEEHERPGEFLPALTVSAPLITDLSGTSIGAYRLVRLLGGGGMGAVYLAERSDGAFSKQVAVKVLSPAFFHAQERFQQERQFLARLDHPNITRLLDGGSTSSGLPYLVVEYVEGVPITEYCWSRTLALDERLELLLQLCAGIAHAHQHLIIHSDIKPENILVAAGGTVKVLDFGIATLRGSARTGELNRPATPAYSSPEQLSGEPLTTATDVYSIGVLAYEVLTGTLPYPLRSKHLGEILHAVLKVEPVPASVAPGQSRSRARQLRGDLDAILVRAISKDPARRYPSAQQLAEDIERHRTGFPVRARPDTIGYRLQKFVGRYRFASALACLTIVCLMLGIAFSAWQASVARRRFEDLRQLAHAVVFNINDTLAAIPGTTTARKLVVETALRYLDRLARENLSDPALREELAAAYVRIGKVQGGAFLANLGDSAGAVASFHKALATIRTDTTTPGLKRIAIEAHINIALLATDPLESLPDFDAAIEAAERQLALDPNDVETLGLIADACHGRGTVDHAADRVADQEQISSREIGYRRRVVAVTGRWRDEVALAGAMAQRALALEQKTDYAASLAELNQAALILVASLALNPGNQVIARGFAEKRSRAGSVLLAMGKTVESSAMLEHAIQLLEPLVAADPDNAQYRGDLAYSWYRLAEVARARGEFARALDLHQQALAVRRERVARDPSFTFIRWDLSRSLNAVGDLLLLVAPPDAGKAAALFSEARDLAEATLKAAPSFLELRKQVARAHEGLGRAAMVRTPTTTQEARFFLELGLRTWQDILQVSAEDRRDAGAPLRLETMLSSLPPR